MEQQYKRSVLVVDDSEETRDFVKEILSDEYLIDVAENGEQAIEYLKNSTPAVVLLDLMMPGIDGYGVCRHIRLVKRFNHTKVILLSATSDLKSKLAGYRHGANDFMTKPFVVQELRAKIGVYIDLYNAERDLASLNEHLQEEIEDRSQELLKIEIEKMQSLRPSEIVHNMKNPLTIVQGMTDVMITKQPESKDLKSIQKATGKLISIVNSVLEIEEGYRPSDAVVFDIRGPVEDELEIISFLSGESSVIDIQMDFSDDFPQICGQKYHFTQIFGNLIKNAVDAMKGVDQKSIMIKTSLEDGQAVIAIVDNGKGIPEDQLGQIFESRFTTKQGDGEGERKGSGLGLGYCKKVVAMYQGEISVESRVDEGSVFYIKFPEGQITLQQ